MRERMREMYQHLHKGHADVVLKHINELKLSDEQVSALSTTCPRLDRTGKRR